MSRGVHGSRDIPIPVDTPFNPWLTDTDQVLKHKFQGPQDLHRLPACSVLPKADLAAGVHSPWPAEGPENGYWLGCLLYELKEAN